MRALIVEDAPNVSALADIVFGVPAIEEWQLFHNGGLYVCGGNEVKYPAVQPQQPSQGMEQLRSLWSLLTKYVSRGQKGCTCSTTSQDT